MIKFNEGKWKVDGLLIKQRLSYKPEHLVNDLFTRRPFLFDLWLSVPDNSNGHVGALSPLYGTSNSTLGCHDTENALDN